MLVHPSLTTLKNYIHRSHTHLFHYFDGSVAMAGYDVTSLTATLTAISEKLDDVPEAGNLYLPNLKRELKKTLDFLRTTITSATTNQTATTLERPLPIVDGFKTWVDSLTSEASDSEDPDPDPALSCTTLWYYRTFQHRNKWTKSATGFLLYLSLLSAQQPKAFEWAATHLPIAQWRADGASLPRGTIVDDTSYYLSLLNAELNNHEPEEYFKEILWTEVRNAAVPDYEQGATAWIWPANRFWASLRPQIFTLFNPSNKYNFIQWALEWARCVQAEIFRPSATEQRPHHAEATIDLTNDLCSGKLSPLHIAALLGLPHLCRDLISAGMDPNHNWRGRTPLHCALEGDHRCLQVYAKEANLDFSPTDPYLPFKYDLNLYHPQERAETIRCILDAPATTCDENSRGTILIAPTALWASYQLDAPEIFQDILARGAAVTEKLCNLLMEDIFFPDTDSMKVCLSRMLTALHGKCLLDEKWRGEYGPLFSLLIEKCLKHHGIYFHIVDGFCPLPEATPGRLVMIAQESILSETSFDLCRVCLDPRFNPNPVPGESEYGSETLLHMAVEIEGFKMVDALMHAGADLTLLDENDRTPLMNAESPRMLEKLILEYGASTECQDREGRTIWHSAAYNNDLAVLSWLAQHDPWKKNNMVKRSDEGCTPLAEAMLLIERIKDVPLKDRSAHRPLAARYLLKRAHNSGDDQCLASPTPLTHLVAAWGDLEMVDDLAACEADWHQLDDEGRTALHYLNFSASPSLVKRLQELCAGVDMGRCEQDVVETLFSNLAFTSGGSEDLVEPSAHPSCTRLSMETLDLLLTPELVKSVDNHGRHWWERFCANTLQHPFKMELSSARQLTFVSDSLQLTLLTVIEEGVLDDYEEKHNKSGILCMFDENMLVRWHEESSYGGWVVEPHFDLFMPIIRNTREGLFNEFCRSDKARLLMSHAARKDDFTLVRELCKAGVKVTSLDCERESLKTPLLTALDYECRDLTILGIILEHVTAEELTQQLPQILRMIIGSIIIWPQATEKMRILLEKGMDPCGIRNDEKFSYGLHQTIVKDHFEIGKLLIEHGADLTQPCWKCKLPNIAFCAARFGNSRVLEYLFTTLGEDFPWGEDYPWDDGDEDSESEEMKDPDEVNDGHKVVSIPLSCLQNPEGLDLILSRTSASKCLKDAKYVEKCFRKLLKARTPRRKIATLRVLSKHSPEAFNEALELDLQEDREATLTKKTLFDLFAGEEREGNYAATIISFMKEHREHFQKAIKAYAPREIQKCKTYPKQTVKAMDRAGFTIPSLD